MKKSTKILSIILACSVVLFFSDQQKEQKKQHVFKPYQNVDTVFEQQVDCLAQNIYHESRGEPLKGQRAVAQVTVNRVMSDDYPDTVCEVVFQRNENGCQFSWTCSNPKIDKSSKEWELSITIARGFLTGEDTYGKLDNVTFYHASRVNPYWAKTKKFVARIGKHLFYGEKDE